MRKWKPILQQYVDWPTGTDGKVFWYDEGKPAVLAILYLRTGVLGVVERGQGARELDEVIYLADLPKHPEWI